MRATATVDITFRTLCESVFGFSLRQFRFLGRFLGCQRSLLLLPFLQFGICIPCSMSNLSLRQRMMDLRIACIFCDALRARVPSTMLSSFSPSLRPGCNDRARFDDGSESDSLSSCVPASSESSPSDDSISRCRLPIAHSGRATGNEMGGREKEEVGGRVMRRGYDYINKRPELAKYAPTRCVSEPFTVTRADTTQYPYDVSPQSNHGAHKFKKPCLHVLRTKLQNSAGSLVSYQPINPVQNGILQTPSHLGTSSS